MREVSSSGANGSLQATIFRKCSREFHRPESNKGCASGTCQHTCEASGTGKCPHRWTVRYVVNGVQREKSFADEIDAGRRVRYGTGLKKARDFQLELTRGKRAQGRTYVDPAAGSELFGLACEAFIMSGAIAASPDSRELYMSCYRARIKARFGDRTLAQMSAQAAAGEVTELLNVTLAGRSIGHRRVTRMLITGTMDAAARAEKIGRHKLTGIRLTEGTRAPAAPDDDDDEAAGRTRTLAGVGIAPWIQRTTGLRIREALGTEKADFRTRKNGERYLRLRSQAARDGRGRAPPVRVGVP